MATVAGLLLQGQFSRRSLFGLTPKRASAVWERSAEQGRMNIHHRSIMLVKTGRAFCVPSLGGQGRLTRKVWVELEVYQRRLISGPFVPGLVGARSRETCPQTLTHTRVQGWMCTLAYKVTDAPPNKGPCR